MKILCCCCLFLSFLSFAYSQDDSIAIFKIVQENDLGKFKEEVSKTKAILKTYDSASAEEGNMLFFILSYLSIELDRPELCQVMIDSFADIKIEENYFAEIINDFLSLALTTGSPAVVKYLIELGYAVPEDPFESVLDCEKLSAELTWRKSEKDYLATLQTLLDKGILIPKDNTLLDYYFTKSNCAGLEIARWLVEHGATGNTESLARLTAMQTNEYQIIASIKSGDYSAFKSALMEEIDLNFLYNDTLLFLYPIYYDRPQMLIDLLELGADLDAEIDKTKHPAFFEISLKNSLDLYKILLLNIKNVNKTDTQGKTLLFMLTKAYAGLYDDSHRNESQMRHFAEVFELLAANAADFNIRSPYYGLKLKPFNLIYHISPKDSLDRPIYKIFLTHTRMLDEFGANLVEAALESNSTDIVQTLIDNLNDFSEVIEKARNKNDTAVLGYLLFTHGNRLKEAQSVDLLWYFGLDAIDVSAVIYLVDTVMVTDRSNPQGYQSAILNRYRTDALGNSVTLLFGLIRLVQEQPSSDRSKVKTMVELLLNRGASIMAKQQFRARLGSTLDYLILNFAEHEYLYSVLFEHLVKNMNAFEVNARNSSGETGKDGKVYERVNIYQYETKNKEDGQKDFCLDCRMAGPSNLPIPKDSPLYRNGNLSKPETHNGQVAIGNNTKRACSGEKVNLLYGRPGYTSAIYHLGSDKYNEDSIIRYNITSIVGFDVLSMACKFKHVISQCTVDESKVECLPIIDIWNDDKSTSPIIVVQRNVTQNLSPGRSIRLDRTLGQIELSYAGSGQNTEVNFTVRHNITDIDLFLLRNRNGSSIADRLYFYLLLYKAHEEKSFTRSHVAVNRLVGEYALEKGFKRSVKERLDEAFDKLKAENENVLKLYGFYKSLVNSQSVNRQELISLMNQVKSSGADQSLVHDIERTITGVTSGALEVNAQLGLFTSSYFKKLSGEIHDFKLALLEYTLYESTPAALNDYKNNSLINSIL